MSTFSKNLLAVSVMLAASGMSAAATVGKTTMVTLTPQKIVGNNASSVVALSKSGGQVAFQSNATNLVLQDGNSATDVFLRVGTSTIQRMSINSLNQEAQNSACNWYAGGAACGGSNHANSSNPSISSDGKLVAFQSQADNLDLLTQDANNNTAGNTESDIFLRDVSKKKTYRLSGILYGSQSSIPSGLLDVFGNPVSSADAPWKVMTEGNAQSYNPVIAGTAKQAWVAFESRATNLTGGVLTTTANRRHIYAIDLKTKKLEMIDATHDAAGVPLVEADASSTNPAISPDGRFVTFQSSATNLTATNAGGTTSIFIYDRKMFKMYQLSGVLGTASPTNGYTVTAEANDNSANPSITGGGTSKTKSYVIAFDSRAGDLDSVPGGDNDGDDDIFVAEFAAVNPKDANTAYEIKSVKRINAPVDPVSKLITGSSALQGNTTWSTSTAPVIAGTNTAYKVAFRSDADNLLADPTGVYWNQDSNGVNDIYVYDSKTLTFTRANVDVTGEQGTANANNPAISGDGKTVGFDTTDNYLTPDALGNGNRTQVYTRK